MRNVLVAIAAALGLLIALPGSAQDRKSDWPEGSAMHTAFVFSERLDAAQVQLEQRQERLLALAAAHRSDYMGNRVPSAIEAEHASWLAYREASCELFGALTGAGGTWPTTHALGCEADWTEQRLQRATQAVDCIEALPPEEREFGLGGCLAPMEPPVPDIGEG